MGEVVEIDSKGRIVIPSSIRNKFGLSDGARLVIEIRDDEIVLLRIVSKTTEQSDDKADSLKDFLIKS